MNHTVNGCAAIGLLVVIVWAVVFGGLLLVLILKEMRKIQIRRNDSGIFKAAEEARRDFS